MKLVPGDFVIPAVLLIMFVITWIDGTRTAWVGFGLITFMTLAVYAMYGIWRR